MISNTHYFVCQIQKESEGMDDAKQEKTLPSPFPVPQEVLDAFERVENYVRIGEAMAMMEASSTSDQVKTEEEKIEEDNYSKKPSIDLQKDMNGEYYC